MKPTRPLARSIGGSRGSSVIALPANWYSPATLLLRHVLQRQLEAQAQPAAAERGHGLGDAARHALDGAFADELEEHRRRPLRGAVDDELRIRVEHAGQRHAHVLELRAEDAAAATDDVDLLPVEHQVASIPSMRGQPPA